MIKLRVHEIQYMHWCIWISIYIYIYYRNIIFIFSLSHERLTAAVSHTELVNSLLPGAIRDLFPEAYDFLTPEKSKKQEIHRFFDSLIHCVTQSHAGGCLSETDLTYMAVRLYRESNKWRFTKMLRNVFGSLPRCRKSIFSYFMCFVKE